MGPNIIFDKSLLQSLNVDESVWLDMFFTSIITPLFFIETLADLEKEVKKGRTPEQFVGSLALKTPECSSYPNLFHRTILEYELKGLRTVDMNNGRPIVAGGFDTKVDNQKGVVFEVAPEKKALGRWQKGEFLQLEHSQARLWRVTLSKISPEEQSLKFQGWFGGNRPSSLSDIKKYVDSYIAMDNIKSVLEFGLELLDVNSKAKKKIVTRWKDSGSPKLRDFIPYFCFVLSINLFFLLARAANMISERLTNMVDISYLYYLPFCMVFTSTDNLHRKTVPLFLRENQSFIWGIDLKNDLKLLDDYFDSLPEDIKKKGAYSLSSVPPINKTFLVTEFWDKHMKKDWRSLNSNSAVNSNNVFENDIIAKMKKAVEKAKNHPKLYSNLSDEPEFIITTHYVHRKKGKWNIMPPKIE